MPCCTRRFFLDHGLYCVARSGRERTGLLEPRARAGTLTHLSQEPARPMYCDDDEYSKLVYSITEIR